MSECEVRFDRRAVLVSGAGRGIGRATAILLASRGASVVVADNGSALAGDSPSTRSAEQVSEEIAGAGGIAIPFTADLSSQAGPAAAVAACLEAFGRIDGIAHLASPCPELAPPGEVDDRDIELLMAVNPIAALRMARAAWPHWERQGYGRLLLTPSAAIYGAAGNAAYAMAKSAYLGLVRCLALDARRSGIVVNAIMPAARTRMTDHFLAPGSADDFFAAMTPEKVAAVAAWLLSEACDVNGETFAVGGGRLARVTLAESDGVLDLASPEQVGAAIRQVVGDERYFMPRDLGERSARVAALLGFERAIEITSAKPEASRGSPDTGG